MSELPPEELQRIRDEAENLFPLHGCEVGGIGSLCQEACIAGATAEYLRSKEPPDQKELWLSMSKRIVETFMQEDIDKVIRPWEIRVLKAFEQFEKEFRITRRA